MPRAHPSSCWIGDSQSPGEAGESEKQIANREVKEEEKAENVKVSTKSIESMSL